ncbi:MAG TPA: alpha/beta hydrolase [Longimicrobiales bacterium]|nr:alpha/beta hydrolase [Longimicrobiales bacterium]
MTPSWRGPRVSEEEALGRPAPPADRTVRYGRDAAQEGDLRLPAGPGPHPVAVVLHGGCWRAIADRRYMAGLAAALAHAGWATWNLDYRTVDDPGGGYPGTFRDVGEGIDHLRHLADDHALDLERVVAVGHSAGAHLALWAAARSRIPASAPVGAEGSLPLRGVVALAGIADLEDFDARGARGCGEAVRTLLGAAPADAPDRCALVSPGRLLPLGVPQLLMVGENDPVVPSAHVRHHLRAARAAGDPVELVVVPGAAHFELVAPWWLGWDAVGGRIAEFLNRVT